MSRNVVFSPLSHTKPALNLREKNQHIQVGDLLVITVVGDVRYRSSLHVEESKPSDLIGLHGQPNIYCK